MATRGEDHFNATLTWHDVELIRSLREDHGLTYTAIAEKFEVSKWCIRDICTYRTWSYPKVIPRD